MGKQEIQTFLDQHRNFIIDSHAKGIMPETIATMLCDEVKRPGAVTNRQISRWLYQRKKAGQLKTYPVSGANGNLRADKNHQASGCVFFDFVYF